jgi:hypothetical protein
MPKRLTDNEIKAARLAIAHAEADAECGGEWDDERSQELDAGVRVLTQLLNEAITKAEGRSE